MQNNLVTFQKRHEYYNNIYDDLHPSNNKNTRIYTKPKQNFDFFFENNELKYSKYKDLAFNRKSLDNFRTIKDEQLDPEKMDVQSKISFYLTNNLVPGFNHNNFDNFKKEKNFQSPDLISNRTYKIDKWYFMKRDDLTLYYEKFFLDKEVDKMRKKNAEEKLVAKVIISDKK